VKNAKVRMGRWLRENLGKCTGGVVRLSRPRMGAGAAACFNIGAGHQRTHGACSDADEVALPLFRFRPIWVQGNHAGGRPETGGDCREPPQINRKDDPSIFGR